MEMMDMVPTNDSSAWLAGWCYNFFGGDFRTWSSQDIICFQLYYAFHLKVIITLLNQKNLGITIVRTSTAVSTVVVVWWSMRMAVQGWIVCLSPNLCRSNGKTPRTSRKVKEEKRSTATPFEEQNWMPQNVVLASRAKIASTLGLHRHRRCNYRTDEWGTKALDLSHFDFFLVLSLNRQTIWLISLHIWDFSSFILVVFCFRAWRTFAVL